MSQEKDDYFDYVENVLGVKSILLTAIPKTENQIQVELLFCVQNYKSYSTEEFDLLQKMIAAVKVDPSRLMVCDLAEATKFEVKALVVFQDETQVDPVKAQLTVKTYSPRLLLKKSELKKQAWTELQKILQFFA